MRKLAVLMIATSCFALGAEVSKTERMDFPSPGTLRLQKSDGELTVEGWDQPGIEITTIRTAPTDKQLSEVRITTEQKGNELVVSTLGKRRATRLEYRIKAPANAHLIIEQESGEIHINGINGEIHASDRRGQITVQLPADGQYAIDARSKLGAIDSDFPGDEHRKYKFGHTFLHKGSSSPQVLYLRVGFGDITILAARRPTMPLAPAQK